MKAAVRRSLPMLLAVLFIPLCILPIQPFVSSGMNDDWSYMESARALFLTGHVRYNGWAAFMLGWQLYLSDLLFHVFGLSYGALRMSTVLIAAALTVIVQRIFIRGGLRAAYAYLGTFTFVVSPLFVPLAFSYMSDIYGTFSLCLCLLLCMEAVRSSNDGVALGWLCAAMVSNALTGTTRQVAWIGVLVVCVAALWLLRERRRVFMPGAAVLLLCWSFVAWCMHWFHAQPFVPHESFAIALSKDGLMRAMTTLLQVMLESCVLCLPVLFLFLMALRRSHRLLLLVAGGIFALCAIAFAADHALPAQGWLHRHLDPLLLFPYLPNYITTFGGVDGGYFHGARPVVLGTAGRAVWTSFGIVCGAAFVFVWRRVPRLHAAEGGTVALSGYQLRVLTVPYVIAYALAHLPRVTYGLGFFDRYLLPWLVVVLLYVLRAYQARVASPILWPAWALLVLTAGYSVTTTHDLFALHRARVAAIQELLEAHVDPPAIDGNLEYNGTTQIERMGFVVGRKLDETRGAPVLAVEEGPATCVPQMWTVVPVVRPRYAISFNADMCGGRAPFAPVFYYAWLGQHRVPLYILNVSPEGPRTP